MTFLDEKDHEEINAAIDAYEWKHSWHLPKDRWGYTDWHNDKTLEKVLEVLRDYRSGALRFAATCDRLEKKVSEVLHHRKLDQ